MRALLCKEFGPVPGLQVAEVPDPVAGDGQVLVRVEAAGLNYPDGLMVQGKYQVRPPLPFVPGMELAGVVDAVGKGVDAFAPGDPVMATTGTGAFAERCAVPVEQVLPRPASLPADVAAAALLTYGTTLHALEDRARLRPGETLLVLGAAGGVGIAAVQLGKAMGARVIAAASSDAKLQVCKANGADETINYASEDLRTRIKAITQGRGVDVVYDPVGGPYSEPALRDMAWNGRYLVVGFAAGEIPKIPLNLALLKGCSIVGVFWGAFTRNEAERNRRNNDELMQLYLQGKVTPHIHATYPLERAAEALNEVLNKRVSGKVVLTA